MIILIITFFIIGLSFGSFINCLVYRLKENKTILGRSFCPFCKKKISWFDNIPILSFLLLRARCRFCKKKISWQYPLVEFSTGLLFLLPLRHLLSDGGFLFFDKAFLIKVLIEWTVYFVMVFTFVYDIKYLEIKDSILLFGSAIVIVLNLFLNSENIFVYLKSVFIAILIGAAFFGLQYILTKGKGIGLGDLRIGIFMGAALGHWSHLLVALAISYFIGALISLLLLAFKKKNLKSQIPLGPFLVIGIFIVFVFGQQIISFYLQ